MRSYTLLFILILCAIYPTLYYSAVHYEQKGKALLEKGRYQDALEVFDLAIQLKPRPDAFAYYGKGVALTKLKKTDEAKIAFDEAEKHKPNAAEVYSHSISIPNEVNPENIINIAPAAETNNLEATQKSDMKNVDTDDVNYGNKKTGE